MPGASARPVSLETIQRTQLLLEQASVRLKEAMKIMLDASIDTIDVRAHVAMTKGVRAMSGMSSEVKAKAEDAALSSTLGVPTKAQLNREKHATYDKPKPAKKKAKAPSKRTEST